MLTNSTEAKKIVGVALTKDNVLDAIAQAVGALPEDVLAMGLNNGGDDFESSLTVYVGFQTLLKIKTALAGVYGSNVVVNPNFTIDNGVVRYMGIEITSVWGIGENDIIVADSANFLLGTDLLSDLENIRLGQKAAPEDSIIFIDGRLRLGFAIPFEDEVVYYSPNNTEAQGFAAPLAAKTTVTEPTYSEVIATINASTTLDKVNAILQAELAGKNRKTVIDAANKKIEELSKTE